eukprot:2893028-Pyramimonas_sp.AAC.1
MALRVSIVVASTLLNKPPKSTRRFPTPQNFGLWGVRVALCLLDAAEPNGGFGLGWGGLVGSNKPVKKARRHQP